MANAGPKGELLPCSERILRCPVISSVLWRGIDESPPPPSPSLQLPPVAEMEPSGEEDSDVAAMMRSSVAGIRVRDSFLGLDGGERR